MLRYADIRAFARSTHEWIQKKKFMNETVKKKVQIFQWTRKNKNKINKMFQELHVALDVHARRCGLMKNNIAFQALMETHLPHHHALQIYCANKQGKIHSLWNISGFGRWSWSLSSWAKVTKIDGYRQEMTKRDSQFRYHKNFSLTLKIKHAYKRSTKTIGPVDCAQFLKC